MTPRVDHRSPGSREPSAAGRQVWWARRIGPVPFLVTISGVLAISAYRAVTQSVAFDEAYTYLNFVQGPLAKTFAPHPGIANNHLLNTLLARLTTGVLGTSELTLRLPALLGAALYLSAAHRLVVDVARATTLGLLALIILVANPLVADFLVAARGYGLGLALTCWALVAMIDAMPPAAPSMARLASISILLALSTLKLR